MTAARHLTKAERDQAEAAGAVLARYGFSWTVELAGKHKRLRAVLAAARGRPEQVAMLTIACTPRDADMAVQCARQNAQRAVHEVGRRLKLW